jgi:hypothetical protein
MRWRLPSAQYQKLGREGRAAALRDLVSAGRPAGVLAYQGGQVVGWCSVAPRETYAAVRASRVIPGWPARASGRLSASSWRRRHDATGCSPLLEAACAYAAQSGARIAEAYPWPDGASYRYMGTRDLYIAAGFARHDRPRRLPPRHAARTAPRWPHGQVPGSPMAPELAAGAFRPRK